MDICNPMFRRLAIVNSPGAILFLSISQEVSAGNSGTAPLERVDGIEGHQIFCYLVAPMRWSPGTVARISALQGINA